MKIIKSERTRMMEYYNKLSKWLEIQKYEYDYDSNYNSIRIFFKKKHIFDISYREIGELKFYQDKIYLAILNSAYIEELKKLAGFLKCDIII